MKTISYKDWRPGRVQILRKGRVTIAVVHTLVRRGSGVSKVLDKPAIGIATRDPHDPNVPNFAKKLAIYRAVRQDFAMDSWCFHCAKELRRWTEVQSCVNRTHAVRMFKPPPSKVV